MAVTVSPGMVIDTGTWEALARQHGDFIPNGPAPQNVSKKPTDDGYLPRDKQQPVYRYFLTDGTTVDARTSADGQGMEVVEYKPSPKFTQEQRAENPTGAQRPANATPRVEGTPTGQTDANGQPVFDNSKPIMVWRTPDNKQAGPAEPLTEGQRAQWEREKNQGAGVGAYTDTQIAEQARQPAKPAAPKGDLQTIGGRVKEFNPATGKYDIDHGPSTAPPEAAKPTYQTVKGGDGQDYIRSITIGPDGKPVIQAYGPNGQPVAAIPGEKEPPKLTQTRGDDGQVYTTVTTIGADNKVTVQTVDQQGKPVEKIPTKAPARERLQDPDTKQWLEKGDDGKWRPIQIEGQEGTGNQGPSLPHVVLGQMKDGLTAYREDLTRQVGAGTLTPAVAERRWKEATDIAEFGIRESSLLQQDEISRRSSDVSLRTNAMSNGTAVFNNALDFIAKINPTLKVGSTAGARAFREILQMHQNQMESLGAYRNEFSGAGAPRGAPPRGAAAAASVPGVSSADRRPPTEIGQPGDPTLGDSLAAPEAARQQQAANPPTFADSSGQFGIPGSYSAGPAAAPSLIAGPSGTPSVDTGNVGISPDGSAAVAPDGSTAPVDVNRPLPTAAAPTLTAPITVKHKVTGLESQVPASSWQDMTNRDDFEVVSGTPPPIGMTLPPGQDIGVLSAYQPMTPPVAPPPMTAPTMDSGPLPGVLRAQHVANTVPWQLSNDDLEWARQNGLLDHAMAVPGVGA